jgi:hypothetical protein
MRSNRLDEPNRLQVPIALPLLVSLAALCLSSVTAPPGAVFGQGPPASAERGPGKAKSRFGLPLILHEDFEAGSARWQPTDPNAWKVLALDGNRVFALIAASRYRPPHRSPSNIALLKQVCVSDFVLEARVRSTTRDYPHRDMCLFFGYQDAAHFYYVHLGQRTDPHANQIFIVDGAPRTKISIKTTRGTPWDENWHKVRIVRRTGDGTIEVYFDDMTRPVMLARNRRFLWGRIGLGSFDDTGYWDDVKLWGKRVTRGQRKQKQ